MARRKESLGRLSVHCLGYKNYIDSLKKRIIRETMASNLLFESAFIQIDRLDPFLNVACGISGCTARDRLIAKKCLEKGKTYRVSCKGCDLQPNGVESVTNIVNTRK